MSDKITESKEFNQNYQDIPILFLDGDKYITPLTPKVDNLLERIHGDGYRFAESIKNKPHSLLFGTDEAESVDELLEGAEEYVKKYSKSESIFETDLIAIGQYLEWTYLRQTEIPANVSNLEEATAHGPGAKSVWLLFNDIRSKLEKKK